MLDRLTQYQTDTSFEQSQRGIEIYYPRLDAAGFQTYYDQQQREHRYFTRARLSNPGNGPKYIQPKGTGQRLYFTPAVYNAYRQGRQLRFLVLVEGEFKAWALYQFLRIPAIGLGGIWGYLDSNSDDKALNPDLLKILQSCSPSYLIYLQDADCRELSWEPDALDDQEAKKDLAKRGQSFAGAVRTLKGLADPLNAETYFAHVAEDMDTKGVDDLILSLDNPNAVYEPLTSLQDSDYFRFVSLLNNAKAINDYFFTADPAGFYWFHADQIGPREFTFNGQKYQYNPDTGELDKTENFSPIWEGGNKWLTKDKEGRPQAVTNFTFRVLYHLQNENREAKQIILARNEEGTEILKEVNPEELTTPGGFKKTFIREGNFLLVSQSPDWATNQILRKVLKGVKPATEVEYMGWQPDSGFFAFSNGLLKESRFYPVNEFGIAEIHGQRYYIAAASQLNANQRTTYRDYLRIQYRPEGNKSLSYFAHRFTGVFGHRALTSIAFATMTYFSDIVFEELGSVPMLFYYGPPGSGKNQQAEILTSLWGRPQDTKGLMTGITEAGLSNLLKLYSNVPLWLDELDNTLADENLFGRIKGLWNRSARITGNKEQSRVTPQDPLRSTYMFSGEHLPTRDPALFERLVVEKFNQTSFSEYEQQQLGQLKSMTEEGVSEVAAELIPHRGEVQRKFQDWYSEIVKELRFMLSGSRKGNERITGILNELAEYPELSGFYHEGLELVNANTVKVKDRFIQNYSALITPLYGLIKDGLIRVTALKSLDELLLLTAKRIFDHSQQLASTEKVAQFWEALQALHNDRQIIHNKHFLIRNNRIYIRLVDVFYAYQQYQKRNRQPVLDKQELTDYFANHTAYIPGKAGGPHALKWNGKTTKAYAFDYSKLQELNYEFNPDLQLAPDRADLQGANEDPHPEDPDVEDQPPGNSDDTQPDSDVPF